MATSILPGEYIAGAVLALCCLFLLLPVFKKLFLRLGLSGKRHTKYNPPSVARITLPTNLSPEELVEYLKKRLESTRQYVSIALAANKEFQKFFDYHREKIDRLTKREQRLRERNTALKKRVAVLQAAFNGQHEDHIDLDNLYQKAMDELDEFDVRFASLEKEKKGLEMSMSVYKDETGYRKDDMDHLKKEYALMKEEHIKSMLEVDELEETKESFRQTLQKIWDGKIEVERQVADLKAQLAKKDEETSMTDETTENSEDGTATEEDPAGSVEDEGFEDWLFGRNTSPVGEPLYWSAGGLGLELDDGQEEDDGESSRSSDGKQQGDGFVLNW